MVMITSSGDGANSTFLSLPEELGAANSNPLAETWGLKVFPNPVREQINISMNTDYDGEYTISIIDILGKVVRTEKIELLGGISLNAQGLESGHYSLILQNNEEQASIKFVKF